MEFHARTTDLWSSRMTQSYPCHTAHVYDDTFITGQCTNAPILDSRVDRITISVICIWILCTNSSVLNSWWPFTHHWGTWHNRSSEIRQVKAKVLPVKILHPYNCETAQWLPVVAAHRRCPWSRNAGQTTGDGNSSGLQRKWLRNTRVTVLQRKREQEGEALNARMGFFFRPSTSKSTSLSYMHSQLDS